MPTYFTLSLTMTMARNDITETAMKVGILIVICLMTEIKTLEEFSIFFRNKRIARDYFWSWWMLLARETLIPPEMLGLTWKEGLCLTRFIYKKSFQKIGQYSYYKYNLFVRLRHKNFFLINFSRRYRNEILHTLLASNQQLRSLTPNSSEIAIQVLSFALATVKATSATYEVGKLLHDTNLLVKVEEQELGNVINWGPLLAHQVSPRWGTELSRERPVQDRHPTRV